ncbi:MAG TPA: NAD-dependent deacylase [Hyphomicrobiales bacterium]|nr:NAD-dependent deacylase [Hyphomicrobiales bacterium]
MSAFQSIVILTGAGLSAESGLSTFRDKDGIWAQYDYREVATPEGFARNPAKVLEFYNRRRRENKGVQPNAAHLALARLEQAYSGDVLIITQNIDPLHEMAGSKNLIHMHGEIGKKLCAHCGIRSDWGDEELLVESKCDACAMIGGMRPDVVWFGEMPYRMEEIYEAFTRCDMFISIGTSGTVYPAAGFAAAARQVGARTVELNLEPSEGVSLFHEARHGKATEIVPPYVEELLFGNP